MSRESSLTHSFVIIIVAFCAASLGLACSELEARRDIQKGDKLYEEGKYAEAIKVYEGALKEADLDTGHHNLAVTAFAAFQPGVETAINSGYAKKAAEHFQIYLKSHPEDGEIIGLLTTVWLDSDQIDQAYQFWLDVHNKDPKNSEALKQLGKIQRIAGKFAEAVKWDYMRVDAESDPKKKVRILVAIGQLQYSRLAKKREGFLLLLDTERLQIADIGVEALQKAIALSPKNASAHSLLATIYQYRSFAHENGWAKLVDISSQRHHASIRDGLSKKAKPAKPEAKGVDQAADPGSKDVKNGETPNPGGTTDKNEAKK